MAKRRFRNFEMIEQSIFLILLSISNTVHTLNNRFFLLISNTIRHFTIIDTSKMAKRKKKFVIFAISKFRRSKRSIFLINFEYRPPFSDYQNYPRWRSERKSSQFRNFDENRNDRFFLSISRASRRARLKGKSRDGREGEGGEEERRKMDGWSGRLGPPSRATRRPVVRMNSS